MSDPRVMIASQPLEAEEELTPFEGGKRWRSETITLSREQVQALLDGQVLVLDIQGEYIANLMLEKEGHHEP